MAHSGAPLDKPVRLPVLLKDRPDRPALMSLEGSWTWVELDQATSRLAAHYLVLGLKPGDRVASLMPNRIALIAHYLACFKAGLVMTPLNYRYTPPEIDHALEVSGARIILAHAERAADIAASKAAALPLGIITYGADKDDAPRFEHLLEIEPTGIVLPTPEPDAPVAIFFTSGSTGPAKGVTHSVASLGWMFASLAKGYALSSGDVMLPDSSYHPSVENAGVIGVHDLLHGENVRAYVELKNGVAKPSAAELIQFARASVGYKAPEEIVFLDKMPLNLTGKVDRAALKKMAAGHAHHL
jgi:acyl-CoA synthetase (AMP-forming)/AMP-acid ligase II